MDFKNGFSEWLVIWLPNQREVEAWSLCGENLGKKRGKRGRVAWWSMKFVLCKWTVNILVQQSVNAKTAERHIYAFHPTNVNEFACVLIPKCNGFCGTAVATAAAAAAILLMPLVSSPLALCGVCIYLFCYFFR